MEVPAVLLRGGVTVAGREQLGLYTLVWPDGVFPLGADTLALGRFAAVRGGWRVCDLGTGSGALLLLLSVRADGLTLTGVERDPLAARTARDNLDANALSGEILECDIRRLSPQVGRFDLVVCNPPYFAAGSGGDGGAARMADGSFDDWCAAAFRLLKNGGRFAFCHRPEYLSDILRALRAQRLEPKRMQFLAHTPAHAPFAVLTECVKGGKAGLNVLPTRTERS